MLWGGCREYRCTSEERVNFCLVGKDGSPVKDSLRYVRERKSGSGMLYDTLMTGWGNCFSESTGRQRIAVYSGDSLVYRSEWVNIDSDDGCHANAHTETLPF